MSNSEQHYLKRCQWADQKAKEGRIARNKSRSNQARALAREVTLSRMFPQAKDSPETSQTEKRQGFFTRLMTWLKKLVKRK